MASSYVEHTEPLSMSFGVWTQVGPRNQRSQTPPGKDAILGGLLPAHCVHTHTHPFNGHFSGTTQVSWYQKGKTNMDFTEARDSEWQWHHLGHMQVCTLLQTDNHASNPPVSFLQAGCPSCRPTNSIKALTIYILYPGPLCSIGNIWCEWQQ